MKKKTPLFRNNVIELPAVKVFNAEREIAVGNHNIAWISSDAVNLTSSLVEKNVTKVQIQIRVLARLAKTREIIKVVGKRGVISWAHLGILLDMKKENFIVIVCVKGKLSAVSASWNAGDGWYVDAIPVDYPDPWYVGSQVLSRKSV